MNGLLTETQQENTGSTVSIDTNNDMLKKAVDIVYNQQFDKVRQVLQKASKQSIIKELPILLNMVVDKVEKETGQPVNVMDGVKVVLQLVAMVIEDFSKTIIKQPLDQDVFSTIIRNTIAAYLKVHRNVMPPEMERQLQKLASKTNGLKGNPVVREKLEGSRAQSSQDGQEVSENTMGAMA